MKIRPADLFVQVTYQDLHKFFRLICLFKVNCEVFISEDALRSYDEVDAKRLARALGTRKIAIRIHGPIVDPYRDGADKIKATHEELIRFCKILGSKNVVLHVEYRRRKSPSVDTWLADNAGYWREIQGLAEKNSITLLLENHFERNADAIVGLMKMVASDNLKACFDIGHFHAFGEKDVTALLDDYPPGTVSEVHLSDNCGDDDTHLPLGCGTFDFKLFFNGLDARDIRPVFVIEASNLWKVLRGIWYLKKQKYL